MNLLRQARRSEREALSYLRESYALDYRSLAVFRVLVGLVVLIDLLLRSPHVYTLYSDSGPYPRQLSMQTIHPDRWSMFFVNGSPEFAWLLFLAGMVAAILMIVGWRTRTATIVLWIIVFSLQSRNNHANSGADTLLRMSLFWGMFLPLGARWSVDANSNASITENRSAGTVANMVTFGLLLQGACVYFFTAMLKDGSRWREEGTAVYYALGVADVSNPIGNWLFHNAPGWFFQAATMGTLWLEFAVPFMLIIPVRSGWLRMVGVLLIISLHLGIATTMWVGLFPAISIASISAALPSSFWNVLSAHARIPRAVRMLQQRIPLGTGRATTYAPEFEPADNHTLSDGGQHVLRFRYSMRPEKNKISRLLINAVGTVSIVLMLTWNVSTVSSYQPPQPLGRLAMASGTFQQWMMFSPNPQGGTLWFVIEGELASGEKIDVMTPIVANDVSIHKPAVWDQSEGHVMTDKYWRKYFEAIQGRENDLFHFADYACRTWNAGNSGDDKLVRLIISRGFATTLPNSERADPVYQPVGTWNCG